jgi:hypothetical protein
MQGLTKGFFVGATPANPTKTLGPNICVWSMGGASSASSIHLNWKIIDLVRKFTSYATDRRFFRTSPMIPLTVNMRVVVASREESRPELRVFRTMDEISVCSSWNRQHLVRKLMKS